MGELVIKGILRCFALMSSWRYGLLKSLGQTLGSMAYLVAGRRRRIALKNLALCMPHLSNNARKRIAREHFRFYGRSFIERFIFWHQPAQRIRELARIEGLEYWERLKGQPVIVLAPHFLGLDAGGIRFQLETRFISTYAKQSSPALDETTKAGRSRFNDPLIIGKHEGMLPVVRALRSGLPLYFLPDMDFGPRDAVFAPFFDVPAATVTSVARLVKMTGARVLPCVTYLEANGYVSRFFPPWEDFPADDMLAATTYMNRFIEDRIAEAPAQYLWTHKRFKTRPDGQPSVYGRDR
jgi:Kdo2-lipid IVA lauroyltransferase/acyltransferase